MILNSGLDAACTLDSQNKGSGTPRYPDFCRFIAYAAFGTGSAAPAVTDTALGGQVGSRSANTGGFADSSDAGRDTTNDLLWYETTFTRVFSISSNVNATEWGLAAASTGDLSVRELFRADPTDNGSSPITLTLENGDELQLAVTLRVQADWVYTSKSFVITGTAGNDSAGTHDGDASVSSGTSTILSAIRDSLQAVWPGGYVDSGVSALHAVMSDQSAKGVADNLSNSSASVNMTNAAYTPGNYYRDCSGVFATSAANGDHYAWVVSYSSFASNVSTGYRFILTDPVKLTKTSSHKLTLTVRKSIARL